MKMLMSEMKDRHKGRPAAVLGGGPSLPDDMRNLPLGCLLIAVNHHAFRLCRPDFMVYNDDPDPTTAPEMLAAVRSNRVTKVSPHRTSDIVFDMDVWTGFYSSNTAAWFALWLGCDPVILCGMDCYQGDQKYFYDNPKDVPVFYYPLDHHIRPWIEEARAKCYHPERLKVMSGPLVNVFGKYEGSRIAQAV